MDVHFKNLTGWVRSQSIAAEVGVWLDKKPDAVVIEGYSMQSMYRSGLTTVLLIEIGTLIRQEVYKRGVPWYVVPPKTLKQYATGKGNATKAEVKKAIKARWGFSSPSDDVCDAYVLARM